MIVILDSIRMHYNCYIPISIVMAASYITTSTDEDNRTDTNTGLSAENTENELCTDIHTWTSAEKKLQHMTKFHKQYQRVFDEGASI